MSPRYDSLADVSLELFDKVMAVNLRGPFRLAALVGPRMMDAGTGSIINVSSVAAVSPTAHEVPYAAAKAGLNSLTMSLARAFAPSVRVNCIMAGPFLTDIAKSWDMDAFERDARTLIPLGRGGQPEEIVGAALYLASDASSFTTGSIIKVDGGMAHCSS
jgi:NAD(P)-dependent dehydrogenase (short-subunit alcohol dehydrogenase family)